MQNVVNNSLSLATGFKTGILFSAKMLYWYRSMSEIRLQY